VADDEARRGQLETWELLKGRAAVRDKKMKGKVIQLKRPKTTTPKKSIAALARELNLPRSTVRSRLAKGWRPPAVNVQRAQEQPKAPSPTSRPLATLRHPLAIPRLVGAVIMAIAALGIAALALAINAQYGASIGETELASWTFMGLAMAVDLMAVALPPAAIALWRTRQRGLAVVAMGTWAVAASIATLATIAFLQRNLADTSATRAAALVVATATQDQRSEAIAAAKLAVSVAKTSREAECATVRGPRCLQRERDERAAVNALAAAVASPVVSPAKLSDPDPQIAAVSRLAAWLGLRLGPDDFANTRLVLWSLILNTGGLVLAVAFGLARSRGSACYEGMASRQTAS